MPLTFIDKKPSESPEKLWAAMEQLQETIQQLDNEQESISVLIKDKKPIGLGFTGDWHLGSRGTDYRQLRQDLELCAKTEGFYLVTTGDEFDNYILNSPKGGKNEALVAPEYQKGLALHLAKQLKGKIIASVMGCHTNWSRESDDYNWVKHATEKSEAANLGYGGRIYLEIPGNTYLIDVRHKYLYNSSLNLTNTYVRHLTFRGPADVVAFGHYHTPFVAQQFIQDKFVHFIRNGSYKIYDRYAQKLGFGRGKPGIPMVVLHPSDFKIEAFEDLRSGIDYLNYLRHA